MAKLIEFKQDPELRDGAGMFRFDNGVERFGYDPALAAQAGPTAPSQAPERPTTTKGRLLGFEQDPEVNKPGVGMFHFDSGVSRYGADPELAAQADALKSQIDAAPDARTAENGNPFNRSMGDLRNTGARIAADPSSQFTTDHDMAAVANADRAVSDALARGPAPAPGPGPGGAPGPDQPLGVQDVSNAGQRATLRGLPERRGASRASGKHARFAASAGLGRSGSG